jgi:hypothetical protein
MPARTLHLHGRNLPERPGGRLLLMRDVMDMQIETADGIDVGRVDDLEAAVGDDGTAQVTAILAGPQALAGRISSRLRPFARRLLRDRFDSRIPIEEIAELGLTIRLRGSAQDYRLGASDRWLADHVIGRIPGAHRTHRPLQGKP